MKNKLSYIRVAVTLDDGSTSILTFLTVGRGSSLPSGAAWISEGIWKREPTDANMFQEICRAFPGEADSGVKLPKATKYRVIREIDIPQDRTYRDAWKDTGMAIEHDMVKARDIHRNHLREKRVPLLLALDVEYQKADERNDAKAKTIVAEQKQQLRDITKHPDIEKAQTMEELKKVWPI